MNIYNMGCGHQKSHMCLSDEWEGERESQLQQHTWAQVHWVTAIKLPAGEQHRLDETHLWEDATGKHSSQGHHTAT